MSKKASRKKASRNKVASEKTSRNKIIIALGAVLALCLLLRFLHLLNSDHYYILSHDSYYFHWISKYYLLGDTNVASRANDFIPTIWHTGLSYPMGWLSIALSSVSWLSRIESLTWVSKFLPPLLGVIIALLIYWMGSRMYSRAVGIFAALSWAVLSSAIFITSAGYIDRDALSLLLLTAGLLVFYLSKDWQLRIGKHNLSWMLGGLLVVVIEAFLYLEWELIGPLLLAVLLTGYFIAVFFARLCANIVPDTAGGKRLSRLSSSAKLVPTNIVPALRETNWRPFAVIAFLNLLALFVIQDFAPAELFDYIGKLFNPELGFETTSELQGMGFSNLYMYLYLSIPLLIGIYHALKKHRPSDILWLTWFLLFFIFGFFSVRIFTFYTIIPGCMLSGLGLGAIYSFRPSPSTQQLRKLAGQLILIVSLLLSIVTSLIFASQVGSGRLIAPDNNWYDALIYLKEESSEEASVMTWWDYGYWILDIAERSPVADNGYRPESRLHDIAQVYFAQEDSEAVQLMQKYNASYLVFSWEELAILRTIWFYSEDKPYRDNKVFIEPKSEEMSNALYTRALGKDFQSDVLSVFYENDNVVVLALKQAEP